MPRLLLSLICLLTACSPRCGKESPEPLPWPPSAAPLEVDSAIAEASEAFPDDNTPLQPLMREPSAEELRALGVVPSAEHQAVTQAFHKAFEQLAAGKLKESATALRRLSDNHPWHSLAEAASFSAIAAWQALGNCEEALEAGTTFVQAWPHGTHAAETWLKMAFCQKQSGHFSEFEETLGFISRRYPWTPAGLKAKIELGLRESINELK